MVSCCLWVDVWMWATHTSCSTAHHAVPLHLDAQEVVEGGQLDQRDVADLLDVLRWQIPHPRHALSGPHDLKSLKSRPQTALDCSILSIYSLQCSQEGQGFVCFIWTWYQFKSQVNAPVNPCRLYGSSCSLGIHGLSDELQPLLNTARQTTEPWSLKRCRSR